MLSRNLWATVGDKSVRQFHPSLSSIIRDEEKERQGELTFRQSCYTRAAPQRIRLWGHSGDDPLHE
jgi:hypothetical protein